jgi:hypothetical protein
MGVGEQNTGFRHCFFYAGGVPNEYNNNIARAAITIDEHAIACGIASVAANLNIPISFLFSSSSLTFF